MWTVKVLCGRRGWIFAGIDVGLGFFLQFSGIDAGLGVFLQLSIIVVGLEGGFLQLFPRLSLIEHAVGGPYPCW